jgi:Methyltransferase domain
VRTFRAVDVWQVLKDPRTPRTPWSISDALAVELTRRLDRRKPRRILEIGSGLSTAVLGAYAVRNEAKVVTLEHSWKYYEPTRRALARFGMHRHVELKLAPLRRRRFERYGRRLLWYDTMLTGRFDFVFADGPPKDEGRKAVLFAVADQLDRDWEMWLDDGLRDHERICLDVWQKHLPRGFFQAQWRDIDGKGVVVLSDGNAEAAQPGPPPLPPGTLGIALTANGDPQWPRRARQCLGRELLRDSYVVVTTTTRPAGRLPDFVNLRIDGDGGSAHWPRCEAFDILARRSELRYVLHLDDHWSYRTLDPTWLPRALEILEGRSDVDRVCLHHRADTMHHRKPGEVERGFVELGAAPFTDEPSLFRSKVLRTVATPELEPRRRRRWWKQAPDPSTPAWGTVQLFPGVFRRMERG